MTLFLPVYIRLFVSYCWTFIKQEANIRAKPHLWSIVSELHKEMCDNVRAGKSEILSRCFLPLNTE